MSSRRHQETPRLLVVNQFAAVPAIGGGTRHYEIARVLASRGWDVCILASDFSIHQRAFFVREDDSDRRPRSEVVDGVRFVWLWSAPYIANNWRRGWNWLTFATRVFAWRPHPRPDIVVGSSPQLFAALGAWALARRHRSRFVFEVRDLWPESLEAVTAHRGLFYWLLGRIASWLYGKSDTVLVLASGSLEAVARRGVPRSRIWLVPNGVDPDQFLGLLRPERVGLTLLYAGAHGPANGLEIVLEAASVLADKPDVRFLLVGDGPAKERLMREAEQRDLRNVEFRPPVPRTHLPVLFAEADAGLMVLKDAPLFRFGVSPNKLFDYLAAGLPVVCNVAGEVADLLAQAGAGEQAADASGAALARAILRLRARSPAERAAMGAAGREWVLRERNRATLAEQLDRHLRSLL